ncbi:hypothetical protein F4860DRAFT_529224 [Xylaria cubensis]|nr:hypothetical protein F4860DRAFT_529224 [Xylaria cubensis]
MDVATLIPQIQDTLSEISITINELSTTAQNDELDQLEQERERLLAELRASFERERQEIEAKRQRKLEEIKQKRKQEDEDRIARRRQEDQELEKINIDEDTQQQEEYDNEAVSIEDETGKNMDVIEEVARKIIQDGKKKLRDLDEKRRELNHRFDEQLEQSVHTAPLRNRNRKKKGHDGIQKNGIVGDPPSIIPQTTDANPETSNKPDTPSKPQPQSATDSPTKSLEAKKDGELPSQERSDGPSQVARNLAKNLPVSFAEALKRGVSNGSKDIPKLGKPSFNRTVQTSVANHSEHGNEMTTTGAQIKPTVPMSMEDVTAQGSGVITPTETNCITREHNFAQNTELFFDIHSQPGTTNTSNIDAIIPQQNQLDYRAEDTKEHEPVVSNTNLKRRTPTQRTSDQLGTPIIHNVETRQQSKSDAMGEGSEVSQGGHGNGYTPNDPLIEEGVTVEDSGSTFQSSGLPTTSPKRDSRRYGKETYNQMELEQPATPDLFEQDHSRDATDFSHALEYLRTSSQSSQPVEPILSAPRIKMPGDFTVPPGGNVSDLSVEPGSFVTFDESEHMTASSLPIVGNRAREELSSPLPVENETVHGQEQLFDDDKSSSGPSEPHTSDGHSALSPVILIEEFLPMLQEPLFKDVSDDQGSAPLINGSGSWAILAGEADEDCSKYPSSKIPSVREVEYFDQLDTQIRAGSTASRNDDCSSLRPRVNTSEKSTYQDLTPITPTSPSHNIPCMRDHDRSHPDRPSRSTDSPNDQASNYSPPAPVNVLHIRPLSALVSPDQCPTVYDVTSVDPTKTKIKVRSDSIEPHPKHLRQRGRPREQSFESPERALNPRELMFQRSEADVDIRSAWFKRSKRGLD